MLLEGTWNDVASSDQDTNLVRLRDLLASALTPSFYVPTELEEVLAHDAPLSDIGLRTVEDVDKPYFEISMNRQAETPTSV